MVILVDANDNPVGSMPKMEAHEKGLLHRAFSVLIFNSAGELLLQRRALDKYHSGGLWTNTCCSHPRPGEATADAAARRLREEMGLSAPLEHYTSFIYGTELDHGLREHEFDHVYIGRSDDAPIIDRSEVAEYRYMSPEDISRDMAANPGRYSVWFRIIWEKLATSPQNSVAL